MKDVTNESPPNSTETEIGRLADLGVREGWQALLLLPTSYEDFQRVQEDGGDLEEGIHTVLHGRIFGIPSITKGEKGPSRFTAVVALSDGTRVEATWFGDPRPLKASITADLEVWVRGEIKLFRGRWQLSNPRVIEKKWAGRCMPVYPSIGKRVTQEYVRTRVLGLLRKYHGEAAHQLTSRLGIVGLDELFEQIRMPESCESIERLLIWAHCPFNPSMGQAACESLKRLDALILLRELIDANEASKVPRAALNLDLMKRMSQWPVKPSRDQRQAVVHLQRLFSAPHAEQCLISGDVATGKTFVYLTLAAGVVDAGGRVAILEPDGRLVSQAYDDLKRLYPDLQAAIVTKETKSTGAEHPIAIGTTALLSRNAGEFDLVICDEQQKLGVEQRRKLREPTTHQVDATATAIPRTMALATVGAMDTVLLREGHTRKVIRTRIWTEQARRELFQAVHNTVKAGAKTLVIYPSIDKNGDDEKIVSIEEASTMWEKQFQGLVRTIHGRRSGDENDQALKDLVAGNASIGICTTAVEVGINIPNMRRVIVVAAQTYGLTSLHQIRGRLAREGGEGDFDLLVSSTLNGDSLARLRLLEKHTDGFSLAEADLANRGAGELSFDGSRQSGGSSAVLVKRDVSPALLGELEPTVRGWLSAHARRAQENPAERSTRNSA